MYILSRIQFECNRVDQRLCDCEVGLGEDDELGHGDEVVHGTEGIRIVVMSKLASQSPSL